MWKDEIVEEVRRAREAHAAAHGYDLRLIYDDLKRKEQASGRTVVTLPPKPAKPIRRASVPSSADQQAEGAALIRRQGVR